MGLFKSLFTTVGVLLLFHAGFSAHHYKMLVISHELEDVAQMPPLDVVVECVLSLLLVLLAQVASLDLVPARVSATDKTLAKSWAEVMSRSDFNTYTHQGSKFYKRETKKHPN